MRSPGLLVLALLAAGFAAGVLVEKHWDSPRASASAARPLHYACPMHPQYRAGQPGDAPCCGMRLEPVFADSGVTAGVRPAPLTAQQLALAGVVVQAVENQPAKRVLRLTGRVTPDEARVFRLNAAVDGWARTLGAATTGAAVRKGEPLLYFYSPEFLASQQALLYAESNLRRFQPTGRETGNQIELAMLNVRTSEDALRNLGMEDSQIEEVRKTQRPTSHIAITAPADGVLLERKVTPGQRFEKGYELFRVADLSRVWILADVWEQEAELPPPGAAVTVVHGGIRYSARRSNVAPQFDADTRALRVRFEMDNPGAMLRPGVLVTLEGDAERRPGIAVPVTALMDTGAERIVYVEVSPGVFEPRRVETGWRRDGLVEVRQGLRAGDRVVVSGPFLIDSETRMRQVAPTAMRAEGAGAEGRDPVCGMEVKAEPGTPASRYEGMEYRFCNPSCKADFEKDPRRYLVGATAVAKPGAGHDRTHH